MVWWFESQTTKVKGKKSGLSSTVFSQDDNDEDVSLFDAEEDSGQSKKSNLKWVFLQLYFNLILYILATVHYRRLKVNAYIYFVYF